MAYSAWSVVFGEQPSAAKWNILGTNDAHFNTWITGTRYAVGAIAPAGTGSLATTGVGFQPKLIEFTLRSVGSTTVNYGGFGAADGTTQYATSFYNEQSVDNSGALASDKCIQAIVANASVVVDGSFTSFDADGFTLNITTRSAARSFTYVAYA